MKAWITVALLTSSSYFRRSSRFCLVVRVVAMCQTRQLSCSHDHNTSSLPPFVVSNSGAVEAKDNEKRNTKENARVACSQAIQTR